MRDKIRKWLGITELEKSIPKRISEQWIRVMIAECLKDSLDGYGDYYEDRWGLPYQHMRNSLYKALNVLVKEEAGSVSRDEVSKRIDAEKFIDDVVDRIRSKQLGA